MTNPFTLEAGLRCGHIDDSDLSSEEGELNKAMKDAKRQVITLLVERANHATEAD